MADDHQLGVAAMGGTSISDSLDFAARGEFLQNHFAGVSTNVGEGTVMLGIDVGKNFELRPEVPRRLLGRSGLRPRFLDDAADDDQEEPVHRHPRRAHLVLAAASPVKT